MVMQYESRYTVWTVNYFTSSGTPRRWGGRSHSWTKKTLQAAGHVARAARRGAHRKKQLRKPLPGMMLHQDGPTHGWVPGRQWDLIVMLDDATTEIYSAFFVEKDGTLSSVRGSQETMETKRLFLPLYTDRGTHYWYTKEPWAGCDNLGKVICPHSYGPALSVHLTRAS